MHSMTTVHEARDDRVPTLKGLRNAVRQPRGQPRAPARSGGSFMPPRRQVRDVIVNAIDDRLQSGNGARGGYTATR
jgi:hypothetical protein